MGLWAGVGEAEALGELFFDNLATLLSVTDLILGYFLNVVTRGAGEAIAEGYGEAIRSRYQDLYYQRCIPGVAVGLLFGNFYYAYMAGRLAHKEKRDDVTAQPYGINTTGAFITLGAISQPVINGSAELEVTDCSDGRGEVRVTDRQAEAVELSQFVERRLREPVLRIQQRTVEVKRDELFHGVLGRCGKRHGN